MRRQSFLFSVAFLICPLANAMPIGPPLAAPAVLPPLPATTAVDARLMTVAPLQAALRVVRIPVTPQTCAAVGGSWASAAYQMFVDTGTGPRILFPMLTGLATSMRPDPDRAPQACAHAQFLIVGYFPYPWVRQHLTDVRYSLALFLAAWAQDAAAGVDGGSIPSEVSLDPLHILDRPEQPLLPDASPRAL